MIEVNEQTSNNLHWILRYCVFAYEYICYFVMLRHLVVHHTKTL